MANQPYEIHVKGHLSHNWADWLDDLSERKARSRPFSGYAPGSLKSTSQSAVILTDIVGRDSKGTSGGKSKSLTKS